MKEAETITLTFKHKDKEYVIKETTSGVPWIDEDSLQYEWYWWEEGNGGCDCNRSLEIKRHYPDFEEMNCGDEIELVDYDIVKYKD